MKKSTVACVLSSLATASLAGGPAAAQQPPIKIGFTAALTGPFNEYGQGIQRGVVLAVEEWNRKGGVNGRKVEIAEMLDDQLVPDRAVQNMRRILDNKEIAAIVMPAGSGPALATIDMVEADGRPACNPMAQTPAVIYPKGIDQPPRKNVVSLAISNVVESKRLAEILSRYKNVGILHESTGYGVTGADLVKKTMAKLSNATKVNTEAYNQRSQDMTAQIVRLQRAGMEAVLVIGLGTDMVVIRKNLSRLNITVPIYGSTGALARAYQEGAGDLAIGSRSLGVLTVGARPMAPGPKHFVDAYRAKYGTDYAYGPDPENPLISLATISGNGYDCVNVLLDSIRRAGSTEPAAVIKAMDETKGLPGAAVTEISFTPMEHEGMKPKDLGLYQVVKKNGRLLLEAIKD